MNLTICLSAAFLILSHAAFCMPIRGQVKAGNKGLSHVVITDGINFTQTDTKGNFLLDTDQEARFAAKGHACENRHRNDRMDMWPITDRELLNFICLWIRKKKIISSS